MHHFRTIVQLYNPFMTEEQANAILAQYRGVRYYGAAIKAKWDSDLLAGDLIRVMSSEEYKNYVAMMNSMANSSSMTDDEILELKKQINAVGKVERCTIFVPSFNLKTLKKLIQ